jgi:hypothetical protein
MKAAVLAIALTLTVPAVADAKAHHKHKHHRKHLVSVVVPASKPALPPQVAGNASTQTSPTGQTCVIVPAGAVCLASIAPGCCAAYDA